MTKNVSENLTEDVTTIQFCGVDCWSRPYFMAIGKKGYYGSVDILFDDDATEGEVLRDLKEDDIVFLYNSPDDDPEGTKPVKPVRILRNPDAYDHDATYSPDDNKLRIYPAYRFDSEDYQRITKAGYIWAPKQELFVAPMWTPGREDIALEFCGFIDDEDKTLMDRAEDRAERFEEYSENRAAESHAASAGVDAITKHIPFGQPILVGHHSEKRARRDAARIEAGTRKSVEKWEQSKYWTERAAAALRHAKYKERADVRARRIKKIEADKRRCIAAYTPAKNEKPFMSKGWDGSEECPHIFVGLGRGKHPVKVSSLPEIEKRSARWIAHYDNRLAYEKAMLEEQGASDLLKKKPRPKQAPLLNYRAPEGITIENRYHRGEFILYTQVEMTKAEYSKIYRDYKGTQLVEKTHRVRTCYGNYGGSHGHHCVFLTDSKVHEKPKAEE